MCVTSSACVRVRVGGTNGTGEREREREKEAGWILHENEIQTAVFCMNVCRCVWVGVCLCVWVRVGEGTIAGV